MITELTKRLLIASKIKGIGRNRLIALAREPLFMRLPLDELHSGFSEFASFTPNTELYDKALAAAEDDISLCEKWNDQILSIGDPAYPRLLKGCDDAPAMLFVRGNGFVFSEKTVAVIGTREPTAKGAEVGKRISRYFAESDWHIASGLALGVDSLAHRACVEANGKTIAVLAHGLNYLTPKSNAQLADEILLKGGALVSEYSYKTPPFAGQFVERDRIQAGLSRGVIVIQTDIAGGSLHAVRSSMRYERFVFAPAPLEPDISNNEPKIRGIKRMLYGERWERAQFLKCQLSMVPRCLEISGRDDLASAAQMMEQFVN